MTTSPEAVDKALSAIVPLCRLGRVRGAAYLSSMRV